MILFWALQIFGPALSAMETFGYLVHRIERLPPCIYLVCTDQPIPGKGGGGTEEGVGR